MLFVGHCRGLIVHFGLDVMRKVGTPVMVGRYGGAMPPAGLPPPGTDTDSYGRMDHPNKTLTEHG